MKKFFLFVCVFIICESNVYATRGCCSHHGGVSYCGSSGYYVCNDGTRSPSCTCSAPKNYVYGCMDKKAKNYNPNAEKDDGSCKYYIVGCMDESAKNYNPKAEKSDDSCEYYITGCTDKKATNYNSKAEKDDGSCEFLETTSNKVTDLKEEREQEEKGSPIAGIGVLAVLGCGVYFIKKKK